MRKGFYIYIFAGLVAVFSLALVPNQAMALGTASSTLSTSYGGRLDDSHQLSFVAGATLVAGGRIGIVFPSSFILSAPGSESVVASGSISVSSATVATATVSADGTSYTLWLAAVDGVDALNTTTVHISGLSVAYPASGGSHQLNVRTIDTTGASIEEASSTAFSITAVNVAPTPPAPITYIEPPSSKITSPSDGLIISGTYVIRGTAWDQGVSAVSKVEVSADGGKTWSVATGVKNWEYSWQNPAAGFTHNVRSRATDAMGNVETPSSGVYVTVKAGSVSPTPTPTPTPTPLPVLEKPISQMTTPELQAKITQLQYQLIGLLQQLVSILTQQL